MPDFPSLITALFDYVAKDRDELSFRKNDSIIVLETDFKYNDGWWKGKNKMGAIGLFPVNFTDGLIRLKNIQADAVSDRPTSTPLETPLPSVTESATVTPSITPAASPIKNHVDYLKSDDASAMDNTDPVAGKSPKLLSKPKNFKKKKINQKTPTHPEMWSVDEVVEWLESNNFNYAKEFSENEICGEVLLQLSLENLREIGVLALGKRLLLFNLISKLSEDFKLIPSEPTNSRPSSEMEQLESNAFHSGSVGHSFYKTDIDDEFVHDAASVDDIQDIVPSPVSSDNEVEKHIPHVDYYPEVNRIDKLKQIELQSTIKVMETILGIKTYKKRVCVLEKSHLYVFNDDISQYHVHLSINTKIEEINPNSRNHFLQIATKNPLHPLVLMFEKRDLFLIWKSALFKYTIFHTDHLKTKNKIEIVKTVTDALKGTNVKQPNTLYKDAPEIEDSDEEIDQLEDIINSYSIESEYKYDFQELPVISKKQRPYISYINKYTSKQGIIIKDLKDIIKEQVLLVFLTELSTDELPEVYAAAYNKDAKYKLQIRQNMQVLKKYMEYLGIDARNIKIDEIMMGSEQEIYIMLDAIYDVFQ